MVLVDTSVWVDHLRRGNARLRDLLLAGEVLTHPSVIGELALGNLKNRGSVLGYLEALPGVEQATDDDVRKLIEARRIYGKGLGWVDAHLLASALLSSCTLFTLDSPLAALAQRLLPR